MDAPSTLSHLFNNKTESDITVNVTNKGVVIRSFHLNKDVLSLGSNYFKGLFLQRPSITTTDLECSLKQFHILIKWLYTGNIGNRRTVLYLLPVADMLGMIGFIQKVNTSFGIIGSRQGFYVDDLKMLLINCHPCYDLFLESLPTHFDKNLTRTLLDSLIDYANESMVLSLIPVKRFNTVVKLATGEKCGITSIPQNFVKIINDYIAITGIPLPVIEKEVGTGDGFHFSYFRMPEGEYKLVLASSLDPNQLINSIAAIKYHNLGIPDEKVTVGMFSPKSIISVLTTISLKM